VLEKDALLVQSAAGQVQLDALGPRNGFVLVTELDQERCLDPVGKEEL
ncbi:MAG: hypothetical protein ACI91B_003249, partial [Planctomycetota bacterium]